MSQTPKFWLLVSFGVNNSHSDFWLGICPWRQKIGDSSAAVVAFHLCRPYCINTRQSPRGKNQCKVFIEYLTIMSGTQLNLYHLDNYGYAHHI